MPEFEVEVTFDVYCSCGAALCDQSTATDYQRGYGGRGRSVTVEPCQKCLDMAEDAGYDKGYAAAEKDAS